VLNPWTALPKRPPFVLPDDRPYVEAWNRTFGTQWERLRLHLEVLPEPFAGPRDASVVTLGLNPGWSETSLLDLAPRRRSALLWGNLGNDPALHIQPNLTEAFAGTAGGVWGRRTMHALAVGSGLGFEELSRRMLSIEFHGYHSVGWAALPVTLPSQRYGFDLLRSAIARGAIVVVLRGLRIWEVAVPSLQGYRRAYSTNSVRNASISARNLGGDAFAKVCGALRTM
jgi:hypothetical protein